jgi:hypothetical protein
MHHSHQMPRNPSALHRSTTEAAAPDALRLSRDISGTDRCSRKSSIDATRCGLAFESLVIGLAHAERVDEKLVNIFLWAVMQIFALFELGERVCNILLEVAETR